jgi:hypothetical protein
MPNDAPTHPNICPTSHFSAPSMLCLQLFLAHPKNTVLVPHSLPNMHVGFFVTPTQPSASWVTRASWVVEVPRKHCLSSTQSPKYARLDFLSLPLNYPLVE